MMNRFRKPGVIAALMAVILVYAAPLSAQNVRLELAVDGDSALYVTANSASCVGDPNPGCIQTPRRFNGHMQFRLQGGCGQTGYRLTDFRVKLDRSPDWPSPGNPLGPDNSRQFCAFDETGYIDWYNCNNVRQDHMLLVKNANQFPMNFYYEVTAQACDGSGREIYLDPQIRNTGNN